jgi:hypothetical protein
VVARARSSASGPLCVIMLWGPSFVNWYETNSFPRAENHSVVRGHAVTRTLAKQFSVMDELPFQHEGATTTRVG